MSTTILLFGLERTGTSVTRRMLQDHWPCAVNVESRAWKHGPYAGHRVADGLSDAPVVVTVRHPLSRALSVWEMQRDRGATDKSLKEWLRYGSKVVPWALRGWCFAYGYWRERVHRWWQESERPATVIGLEDLLENPQRELRSLGLYLGLGKPGDVEPPEDYVAPQFGPRDGGFADARRRLVEQEAWRHAYGPHLLREAWLSLDLDLCAAYGYEPRMEL